MTFKLAYRLIFMMTFILGNPLGSATVFGQGGFGRVAFPNSGAAKAQPDFLKGMALLHDFEYRAAIEAFRRAQAIDPGFAMAYWGEAMSYTHPIWMQQDLSSARAALNRLAPTAAERRAKAKTDREKDYFDAIEVLYGDGAKTDRDFRFETAMARLHARHPDDVNATAFYGLAILGTAHAGRDIPTYMRAAGIMEEAWISNQDHPGLLHYLIHSYDDPVHAPLGLRAARLYSRVAPDAGHAQHMTSHIFLALGMWRETVDANIAAIAAADRMRGRTTMDCGHYESWLSYAYLQLGQADQARSRIGGCNAKATSSPDEHAEMSMDPDNSRAGSLANMRLRYLIDTADWNGELARTELPKNSGPGARLDFAFANALRATGLRDADAAARSLAELESVAKEVIEIETRRADPDPTWRVRPAIFILEIQGLQAELKGDVAGAERLLREAVSREDSLPIAFGPPTIDKPSYELLGEVLLRNGKKSDARTAFTRALARTPGRRLAVEGLAASR
ncbi:MAG: hypothetical protein IPM66_11190 [Acidobacteriota bacterium]|nr:MAG: hypothetical protein IPM66_11190 [Acidobacteriota bacterium]